MSTPERKSGHWARRQPQPQPQQQQQQQHISPFKHARRDRLRLDAFRDPSPPPELKPTHQRNFSRTGTLRGAFESLSQPRQPLSEKEDDQLFVTEYTEYARRGSPQKRRQSTGAMSFHSNPPDELEEAYRQINDANSLTDLEPSDDENAIYRSNTERLSRRNQIAASRNDQHASRLSTAANAGFTGESPRRRYSDYNKDEERLERAMSSRSPVLNKTTLGARPSSEHLQRRESESHSVSEEDNGIEPSVNAPPAWGSRSKYTKSWLTSLTRSHERGTKTAVEESGHTPSRLSDEQSLKRAQRAASNREPVKEPVEERPRSSHYEPRIPPVPKSPKVNGVHLTGGKEIPNTPIVVYPNSTFTRPSLESRDSYDLLRVLGRKGSPNEKTTEATQTPEPTAATRRVYAETPRVIGAYIDTPVTQRVSASLPREINNALGPKLDSAWRLEKLDEETSRNGDEQESRLPDADSLKDNDEKPPTERPNESTMREAILDTKDTKEAKQQPQIKFEAPKNSSSGKAPESKQEWKPVELPLPDHPKSALETVLQDHKNKTDSLDVGDDTIESLQAIVDQQPSEDTGVQEEEDAAYEQKVIGQLESAQSPDMNDFERIEGKLQSLSDTMTNLKSGLNQLGTRVSRDTEYIIASLSKSPTEPTQSKPTQPQTICEACKTHGHNPSQHYTLPLPRLWRQGPTWWKPRPTRFGWCALLAATWYFTESTMCDKYCHPRIDTSCEGNCLLPDAPRFPYVFPTMISRWLHLSDILLPLWALILAFFRFFTQILGFSDGYVDDEPPPLNLTGKVWVGGTLIDSFPATAAPTVTATARGSIPPVVQWAWKEDSQAQAHAQANPRIPDPVPVSVPDINIGATTGSDPWADISMDEDEFL
ncbi:hypothetical protein BJX70DRAFT_364585 [Aspergillus crustosus]